MLKGVDAAGPALRRARARRADAVGHDDRGDALPAHAGLIPASGGSTFGRRGHKEAASEALADKNRVQTMADTVASRSRADQAPGGFHRLHQLRARGRPLRDADLPDRGDRPRSRLRPHLCRADRARHRVLRRLRHVLAAGRLARRPLEPPQHDGVFYIGCGVLAGRRGAGAEPDRRWRSRCSRSACSPRSIIRSAPRC